MFDVCSLIYAFKLKKLDLLINNYIQWLTIYEVADGLWRGAYLIKTLTMKETIDIAKILREIISYMKILDPHKYEEEILETAYKLGITVYDASYIVLAKNKNLILVTEDSKLREKAENIVETKCLNEI